MRHILLLLVAVTIFLTGCKESTTPVGPSASSDPNAAMYGSYYGTYTVTQSIGPATYPMHMVIQKGAVWCTVRGNAGYYPTTVQMTDPNLVFSVYEPNCFGCDGRTNWTARFSGIRSGGVISGTAMFWSESGTWTVSSTLPGPEPEVSNSPNYFLLTYGWLDNRTQTMQYTWENSNNYAEVTQHPAPMVEGTVMLVVRDAVNVELYRGTLDQLSTVDNQFSRFITIGAGTPGSWTIEVQMQNFTGATRFEMRNGNGDVLGYAWGGGADHTHTGIITRAELDARAAVTVEFTHGSGDHYHYLPLTASEVQASAQGQAVQKVYVDNHPHTYTFN